MKQTRFYHLMLTGLLICINPVMASDLIIFPAQGQSDEQMEKDKYECYQWAKKQTGFDPMAAPSTATPVATQQPKSGGVAKGALGGAALGAIIGDSSRSARNGAVAGGLIGGVRQSSANKKTQQQAEQQQQQQANQDANARNEYNRAQSACLEGKGYTVK